MMHEGAVRVMAQKGQVEGVMGGPWSMEEWSWPQEGSRSRLVLTRRKLSGRLTTRTPCKSEAMAENL